MSALKFTDKELEELNDKLSFNTHPLFEESDVNMVMYALRAYDNPLEWLRYRARLFDNPDIVTHTESVLDGFTQKENIKG